MTLEPQRLAEELILAAVNGTPDDLSQLDTIHAALEIACSRLSELQARIANARSLVYEKWDNPRFDEHCAKVYEALTVHDMHCDHIRYSCRDVGCSGADSDDLPKNQPTEEL